MTLLRTTPNPAFKIAQPLPTLTDALPAARKCPVPFGIPGLPLKVAGEVKFRAPMPFRRPTGADAQPHCQVRRNANPVT
jgi:hypothetical protein